MRPTEHGRENLISRQSYANSIPVDESRHKVPEPGNCWISLPRRPTPSTLSHHKSYRFGRQGAKKHRQWELMPIVGAHSTGFFFRKWLFHDFFASDSRRVDDFCELSQCAYSTESNVHRRTKRMDSYTRQTRFLFAAAPSTQHPNQWSVN